MWAGFPGAATLRLCCPHACPSFLLAIVSCMRQPPSHPIEQDAELYHLACGGASLPDQLLADQAERCRMIVGREEQVDMLAADPSQIDSVVAMQISGNFMFDPATHRDFLGSILGTGIVREKVGDIIVTGEQGAQFLTAKEMVSHFETSLVQVRSVNVQTSLMSIADLKVAAPRVQEIKSVEASMRLDAISSAGFRMSRSKMVDMIKGGDVRVNWESGSKASDAVKAGDIISCNGKGRLEVQSVSQTKKGKFAVEMVRFM
mmetsp:Transcript_33094/g.93663  ORF Transcript_33094/g.93663 Transcript_33094/m.93663 type:complete len:260 (-) Transcript_33094:438-1217(-)